MARQSLGSRKLRRYSREHGMRFVRGLVRGNTGHRVDLYDEQGRHWYRWPDGRLELVLYQRVRWEDGSEGMSRVILSRPPVDGVCWIGEREE